MNRALRDFALEVYFSKWEFVARHNLAGSESQSVTVEKLLAMASEDDRARFFGGGLGYTETFGSPWLRERIAATYETVRPEHLLCFAGAEEAIYTVMRVLLGPEDHAVVITPGYQASETVPLSVAHVTGVPLDPEQNWALDPDRVRAALRPETRLLAVNFPNNPTGHVPPRAVPDALIEICRERGLWLFSDEVYRLLERPENRLPQAVDLYERGISLNVMSKAYGLPGLRIGWLACKDRALLVRCERYKHFLSICNAGPSEILAGIALAAAPVILERNRQIVARNLDRLDAFFAEFPALFDWRRPDGSCVAFVRYKGADGVEAFTRRLVEETGVLLLPSSVYRSELGLVPEDRFRIGFGKESFEDGLTILRDWLRARP